jgi:hypothetical protein
VVSIRSKLQSHTYRWGNPRLQTYLQYRSPTERKISGAVWYAFSRRVRLRSSYIVLGVAPERQTHSWVIRLPPSTAPTKPLLYEEESLSESFGMRSVDWTARGREISYLVPSWDFRSTYRWYKIPSSSIFAIQPKRIEYSLTTSPGMPIASAAHLCGSWKSFRVRPIFWLFGQTQRSKLILIY